MMSKVGSVTGFGLISPEQIYIEKVGRLVWLKIREAHYFNARVESGVLKVKIYGRPNNHADFDVKIPLGDSSIDDVQRYVDEGVATAVRRY